MKKMMLTAAFLAASVLAPAAAGAATPLVLDGVNTFFSNDPMCPPVDPPTASCGFSDVFTFGTPVGFRLASIVLTSGGEGTSDIDFGLVTFNGATIFASEVSTDESEFYSIFNQSLRTDGSLNRLEIAGTTGGLGSYAGLVSIAPGSVPEPTTWAMMLIGFGAVGYALRRRPGYRIAQTV